MNPLDICGNNFTGILNLDGRRIPAMHIDENKKFDKRTMDRKIREGLISQKEYEQYLASLPDVSGKICDKEDETHGD